MSALQVLAVYVGGRRELDDVHRAAVRRRDQTARRFAALLQEMVAQRARQREAACPGGSRPDHAGAWVSGSKFSQHAL